MTGLVYAAEVIALLYLLAGAAVGVGWLRRRTLTEPGVGRSLGNGEARNTDERLVALGSRSLHVPGSLSVLVAGRRATRRTANGSLLLLGRTRRDPDSPQIYDWASGE